MKSPINDVLKRDDAVIGEQYSHLAQVEAECTPPYNLRQHLSDYHERWLREPEIHSALNDLEIYAKQEMLDLYCQCGGRISESEEFDRTVDLDNWVQKTSLLIKRIGGTDLEIKDCFERAAYTALKGFEDAIQERQARQAEDVKEYGDATLEDFTRDR